MKKIILISLFSLFINISIFGQNNADYLAAISAEKSEMINEFKIPVYHQFEKSLIIKVSEHQLKKLNQANLQIELLDNTRGANYFLVTGKNKTTQLSSVIKGEILFEEENTAVVKDLRNTRMELAERKIQAVELVQINQKLTKQRSISQ